MIATTCPECSNVVTFSEQFAGRRSQCPSCRKLIGVPAKSTVAPPMAKPTPRKTAGEVTFSCETATIKVPQCCACCLSPHEEEVDVRWEKSTPVLGGRRIERVTFPFPYCHRCARHVRWYERSWTVALVVGLASFFVILCCVSFKDCTDNEKTLLLFVVLFAAIGVMFAARLVAKLIQPPTGPDCATATKAVHCNPDRHHKFNFRFVNGEYGRQFTELNS